MFTRLFMVTIEATLCAFGIVDSTRRKLRQEYTPRHGKV